jgi:hypothetical protein
VTEADLAEILELLWLGHVHGSGDPEEGLDDVSGGVSLTAQRHDDVDALFALAVHCAGRVRREGKGETAEPSTHL